ncbi:MAG: DUF1761 domain-containing protein [Parachlamydiaceae bacterium]|nr:DUF1761 domain-containing protein [Parachlamydiaceae bacterium]
MMLLQGIHINFFAILIAAAVYFILGGLWYSPKVFGHCYCKHEGMDLNKESHGLWTYIGEFIVDLVIAYVLALFIELAGVENGLGGAIIALWIWIGFVATDQFSALLWSKKSYKSFLVNAGFMLVGLLAMGVVIGTLKNYQM